MMQAEELFIRAVDLIRTKGRPMVVGGFERTGVPFRNGPVLLFTTRTSPAGPFDTIDSSDLVIYRRPDDPHERTGHMGRIDFRRGSLLDLVNLVHNLESWTKGEEVAEPVPTREDVLLIARAIYSADPIVDGGEALEGHRVTPVGFITWEQFVECAPPEGLGELEIVMRQAHAVLAALGDRLKPPGG